MLLLILVRVVVVVVAVVVDVVVVVVVVLVVVVVVSVVVVVVRKTFDCGGKMRTKVSDVLLEKIKDDPKNPKKFPKLPKRRGARYVHCIVEFLR